MNEQTVSTITKPEIESRTVVEIDSLTKTFGSFTALDSCTLSINRGEVFGLLGPNGAGKTTLIRLLLGFLNPTSGSSRIDGLDCHRQRVSVHRSIAYMPGEARLFRLMRGRGVLKFFTQMRADSNFERGLELADRLDLDLNRWVGLMSTGMRQKLALAITLASTAPLLILDEPTANLDPTIRGEILNLVSEAKTEGRTVIFSSHVLSEIEDVCDRVCILRSGKLVHLQSMRELLRRHRIDARLLGDLPAIPPELKKVLTVRNLGSKVQIETADELAKVLAWLASAELSDVYVQPIGLRAVYDRYHSSAQLISDNPYAPPLGSPTSLEGR